MFYNYRYDKCCHCVPLCFKRKIREMKIGKYLLPITVMKVLIVVISGMVRLGATFFSLSFGLTTFSKNFKIMVTQCLY